MVGQTFLLLARRVRGAGVRGTSDMGREEKGTTAKKKTMAGGLWCFALLEPRPDARSHCGPGPRRFPGRVAFLLLRPRRGRSLTVSLWTRATLPALGRVAFFLFAPRLERKETTKAKKHTGRGQGGVFFCSPPTPTLTHLLRAWATTLPGRVVVLFLAPATPNPASQQQRKSGLLHRV